MAVNSEFQNIISDKEIRDFRNDLLAERAVVQANAAKSQAIFESLQQSFNSLSEQHIQNYEARGVRIIQLRNMLVPEVLTDREKNEEFLRAYTEVILKIKEIVKSERG